MRYVAEMAVRVLVLIGLAGAFGFYFGTFGWVLGLFVYLLLAFVHGGFDYRGLCRRVREHLEPYSEPYHGPDVLSLPRRAIIVVAKRLQAKGGIGVDAEGIHLFFLGKFSIPWKFVDALAVMKPEDVLLARLYLHNDGSRDNNVWIDWSDEYLPLIPDFVRVEDMRERSQSSEELMP